VSSSTFAVNLPQSGWFHATFVLAVSGASSTIDFLVDGQSATGGPTAGPPISGNIACYFGVYATANSSQVTWSFDDVYAEAN